MKIIGCKYTKITKGKQVAYALMWSLGHSASLASWLPINSDFATQCILTIKSLLTALK